MRTAAEGYAARLEVDRRRAGSVRELPIGTLLDSPEFPSAWDLNVLVLAPGAGDLDAALAACLPTTRRITVPAPAGRLTTPAGWDVQEDLAMLRDGDPPAWPPGVEEVTGDVLHATRLGLRRTWEDEAMAAELAEMQRRSAVAPDARTAAVAQDGRWVAWAMTAGGCIEDVWVAEDRRGNGLGRAVTTAVVAAGGWFLTTTASDPRPQRLYRSLGFRDAGRVVQLTRPG